MQLCTVDSIPIPELFLQVSTFGQWEGILLQTLACRNESFISLFFSTNPFTEGK